ncbi:MAG: hypothetical protein AB9919_05815 [Geobacteraceae bacterium]
MDTQDYQNEIVKIINDHFNLADGRVDEIYEKNFSDIKEVFSRHWRHKKDIPYDMVNPVKYAYDFVVKKIAPGKKIKTFPKAGKAQEIEQIISDHLLDLPGLENKINRYVELYEKRVEQELSEILENVPALQREKFTEELILQIDRLQSPIDGAREAALCLVVGIVGKVYSGTFCGSIGSGGAVATTIYISQLSWIGSIWANIFGAPAWIGWVGGVGGLLVTLVAAPLLTPFFEIGINKLRAKKILRSSIRSARNKLAGKDSDAINVAGKTAIYLQFLPDVVDAARKTAGLFR